MEIQQFVEQLEQKANPSPLMEALQALRTCNLDQVRDQMKGGLLCEWILWTDDGLAQTPQIYVQRPELRS